MCPKSDNRWRCIKDHLFCQFLRDKSLIEDCVHCSEDEGGYCERGEEVQVFQWIPRDLVC